MHHAYYIAHTHTRTHTQSLLALPMYTIILYQRRYNTTIIEYVTALGGNQNYQNHNGKQNMELTLSEHACIEVHPLSKQSSLWKWGRKCDVIVLTSSLPHIMVAKRKVPRGECVLEGDSQWHYSRRHHGGIV